MSLLKDKVKSFPKNPGVYFLKIVKTRLFILEKQKILKIEFALISIKVIKIKKVK